jgi:hypothetical protein
MDTNDVRLVWRMREEHIRFKWVKPEGKIPLARPRRRW